LISCFQGHFEEICAKRLGSGGELTCMACDTSHDSKVRIVTGTRDRMVQVWKFDSKSVLNSIFSVQLGFTVPVAVGFADNAAKDVYVFGFFDSQL
jgi:hypothetical protein